MSQRIRKSESKSVELSQFVFNLVDVLVHILYPILQLFLPPHLGETLSKGGGDLIVLSLQLILLHLVL